MKKKILVDMDGVLADVYKSLIEQEYTVKGIRMTAFELNGIEERMAFPNIVSIVSEKGFFRHAPIMEGSVEGLRYLNDKYDVRIVSSATEFKNSLTDKQEWLEEFFPFIGWRQMVFCGVKEGILGDIMIDDHPKNLSFFNGERYIFTQPHNYNLEDPTYKRVSGWDEIVKVL